MKFNIIQYRHMNARLKMCPLPVSYHLDVGHRCQSGDQPHGEIFQEPVEIRPVALAVQRQGRPPVRRVALRTRRPYVSRSEVRRTGDLLVHIRGNAVPL